MSLRVRLVAAFAYVLLLVLAAIEIPFALSLRSRVEAEVRAQAVNEAFLIAASASGAMDRPQELRRLSRRAADDLEGRVIVVDSTGDLLADSAGQGLLNAPYGDREEVAAVLESGRAVQGERFSETLSQDLLFTAVPVVDQGVRVGAVRVTQSAEPVDDRVWRDVAALAAIGAAALGFGLVLAWVLAGSLSRPQRALAQTARRLGAGDLEARAEETGPAEQREVAHAFNGMADRLGRVLAAQREFVANASHQLRTPLTGLRLRLEAATYRATDPDLERDLAEAEREVDRLANLLGALLTLAQDGGARPAPNPVSVRAAATAALDRWAPQAANEGRELTLAGSDDVWVAASEDDVATILDALLENALRYSPPDGTVTLEWGHGELAVTDDGPGLESGEEELVFERFRRGAAGTAGPKGTGLGLAIVRALVERWGGSVSIANRAEGGARAVVRLPASPAVSGEAPTEVLAR